MAHSLSNPSTGGWFSYAKVRRVVARVAFSVATLVIMAPAGTAMGAAISGSTPRLLANQVQASSLSSFPFVGVAPTHDARGYWLVASNGGIFSYGDAPFYGSTANDSLNKPIVGMAATPDGKGYWLVASDGGIFTFGDAGFYGSTGAVNLDKPIVGMASASGGRGYWLVASDGGIFNFGDAPFRGSAVSFNAASGAITVGMIAVGKGYWVPNNQGGVDSLGAPAATPSTSTSTHSNALPYYENPSASIAPSSAFAAACYGSNPNVSACNSVALSDIDQARASEGFGALSLPANFYSLPTTSQLIATANAERTSRGLSDLPENANLDVMAGQGARDGNDPEGPANYTWGSNIAFGAGTALAADFGWMYDDGTNSSNVDCSSSGASGCWGHRENILSPWGGAAGGGDYDNGGTIQLAQLFVQNY